VRRILAALGFAVCLLGTPMQAGTAAAAATPMNRFYWGQCTWWAANVRPDIGAAVSGNAANWTGAAQRAGLNTGTVPAQGAIVVYQPGVQGAWYAGHVARVLAVSPDNATFTVDEMNFPIAGRVTSRTSHVGPGVTFIY
jgi:surface antigen